MKHGQTLSRINVLIGVLAELFTLARASYTQHEGKQGHLGNEDGFEALSPGFSIAFFTGLACDPCLVCLPTRSIDTIAHIGDPCLAVGVCALW